MRIAGASLFFWYFIAHVPITFFGRLHGLSRLVSGAVIFILPAATAFLGYVAVRPNEFLAATVITNPLLLFRGWSIIGIVGGVLHCRRFLCEVLFLVFFSPVRFVGHVGCTY
jgi:quinol-cytochrome oxidoreductase complex cytochrome b subunit